jgi:hypothetical protein
MKTNTLIVQKKVQNHIKGIMGIRNLRANVKGLLGTMPECQTVYHTIAYMVQGGSFLCYHYDVKQFLNRLGINPNKKEYTDEQSWKLYTHLIATNGEKLLKVKK